jgi:hypothetical protein
LDQFFGISQMNVLQPTPSSIIEYLRGRLAEPCGMSEVAPGCQLHPNGFLKLELPIQDFANHRHVLHVWPTVDGARLVPLQCEIHSHRWSFTSTVLCGGYVNRKFTMIPARNANYVEHAYSKQLHGFTNVPIREVSLVQREDEFYVAGSSYHMGANEIHSIPSYLGPATATYVVEHLPVASACSVFRGMHLPKKDVSERLVTPTNRIVHELLHNLLRYLDGE